MALPSVSANNQLAFCEGLLRCAESATAKGRPKDAIIIYDHLRELSAPQQVRTAALRGAILARQNDGLRLLGLALPDKEYATFLAAVRTSQEMPGPDVTKLLASALPALPGDRQIVLIQTLATRADVTALPALSTAARSGEESVRVEAIRALAAVGSPSGIPVLLDLLGDTNTKVADAARQSLAGIPGAEADAAVIKMLTGESAARRITAMDLVVRRRMTSAIPALISAARGSDPKLRIAAVSKLGELAGPGQVPDLLDLLSKAGNAEEVEAVEQALGSVSLRADDPASCVGQIEARLPQSPPAQKCALVRVLGSIGGPKALQAVRAAVNDPNAEVHAAAIRTLGAWGTADAAGDLLEQAKAAANPTDKMICLRGYLRLAAQADVPLDKRLSMCREAGPLAQQDDEKRLLLGALGGVPAPEAVELIAPYLDNSGTKEEAGTAIVNISDQLLKGNDSTKAAPKLVEPLDKVAQATANADLAKRAKELGQKAKSKAGK